MGAEFITEYVKNVEKGDLAEFSQEVKTKVKFSYFDLYSKSVNMEFGTGIVVDRMSTLRVGVSL